MCIEEHEQVGGTLATILAVVALRFAPTIYRSLGFRLTDRGYHTLGSANHLAMFATNYLELLGAGRAGGPFRAELAGFPEGLNGLVLATDDADAQYRSLRQRGVAVREPNSFSRPVAIDGVTREARFRTTHLAAGEARSADSISASTTRATSSGGRSGRIIRTAHRTLPPS